MFFWKRNKKLDPSVSQDAEEARLVIKPEPLLKALSKAVPRGSSECRVISFDISGLPGESQCEANVLAYADGSDVFHVSYNDEQAESDRVALISLLTGVASAQDVYAMYDGLERDSEQWQALDEVVRVFDYVVMKYARGYEVKGAHADIIDFANGAPKPWRVQLDKLDKTIDDLDAHYRLLRNRSVFGLNPSVSLVGDVDDDTYGQMTLLQRRAVDALKGAEEQSLDWDSLFIAVSGADDSSWNTYVPFKEAIENLTYECVEGLRKEGLVVLVSDDEDDLGDFEGMMDDNTNGDEVDIENTEETDVNSGDSEPVELETETTDSELEQADTNVNIEHTDVDPEHPEASSEHTDVDFEHTDSEPEDADEGVVDNGDELGQVDELSQVPDGDVEPTEIEAEQADTDSEQTEPNESAQSVDSLPEITEEDGLLVVDPDEDPSEYTMKGYVDNDGKDAPIFERLAAKYLSE